MSIEKCMSSPTARFYTHSSESKNGVIKCKECLQDVSFPQFVQEMKELRKAYEDYFAQAINGSGDFKVKFSHLELSTYFSRFFIT